MAKKVAKETRNAKLFRKYLTKMSGLLASKDATEVLTDLANGNNTYMRIDRLESSAFDSSWIKVIEDVIMDLGDIIANPRQNTKTVADLVPVELARKTNSESIRHLASHTQFIKDVSESGDVVPNKILTIGNDDDLHTYENKFIATLVRKLVLFVEKRYEFVSKFAPLHDEEILMVKNHSFIDNSEVSIETKVKIKTEKDDTQGVLVQSYLTRILKIREFILYFYNSPFMKALKTERNVRNPILQTNIIRKNLKYHHCYEVYRFIEKYESLGITYKVDENYSQFNAEELTELNYAMLVNFLTVKAKHMSLNRKTNTKNYKPKILTSCDDEAFVYGPLLSGPIEFVRTDALYQQYLDSLVRKDLPEHPTKKEKEYYKEEYDFKKLTKQNAIEKEKLLKRKAKEKEAFDKYFEEVISEREIEKQRVDAFIAQELKRRENESLDAIRVSIMDEAKKDFVDMEKAHEEALRKEIEAKAYEEAKAKILEEQRKADEEAFKKAQEEAQRKEEEAKAKVEEEKRLAEEKAKLEAERKAKEEAEAKAKAEKEAEEKRLNEEAAKKAEEERKAKEEAEAKAAEEAARKAEEERIAKEEAEKARLEAEQKAKEEAETKAKAEEEKRLAEEKAKAEKEAEEKRLAEEKARKEAEEKARLEAEKKAKEEAIAKAKAEKEAEKARIAEEKARKQAELEAKKAEKARLEAEKKAALEAKKAQEEKERKAKEEAEKARLEAERKAQEEKARKEAEEKARLEAEAKAKAEEEKRLAEEKAKLEAEQKAKEEAMRKAEAARLAKLEAERKAKEEAEAKAKLEAEKKAKEAQKKEKPERKKIPGAFIVKTPFGYYVNQQKYSDEKDDAKIFDDFNVANDIRNARGGKVVKL